ncbi:SCO-spondin-like [Antedon mediterranea]|uniref:SCO-spondin-like n=1 Tax=Antedon mediterranea TaxID=105859 RepID=UPI003AF96E97
MVYRLVLECYLAILIFSIAKAQTTHFCDEILKGTQQIESSPRLNLTVNCATVQAFEKNGFQLDIDAYEANVQSEDCPIFKPAVYEYVEVFDFVKTCCEGYRGELCTIPICSLPCENGGICLEPNKCDCPTNFFGDQCNLLEPENVTSTTESLLPFATCVFWGTEHFRTFDGLRYNFLGGCEYILAADIDETWSVLVRNIDCTDPLLCRKRLTIQLGLVDSLIIDGDSINFNGVEVSQLPFADKGASIWKDGDLHFLETGIGIRAKWDNEFRIYITLVQQLQGLTEGLCGNYNGDQSDDMTMRNGLQTRFTSSLGNSWKSLSFREVCDDVPDIEHPCFTYPELADYARMECNNLRRDIFAPCHEHVDPSFYHDNCMRDLCSLGIESESSLCNVLTSYARECSSNNVALQWRSEDFCPKTCPGKQVYTECKSSCKNTCASANYNLEQYCPTTCLPGCQCPEGTYLEEGECIERELCPCIYNREKYYNGSFIMQECNQCTCLNGKWTCESEICTGSCSITGAGHITTIDKKDYTFHGLCSYMLLEEFISKKFHVSATFEDCGSDGSLVCITSLSLTVDDTILKLGPGYQVSVNGEVASLPYKNTDMHVHFGSSMFIIVETFGLTVTYDGGRRVYLNVNPVYMYSVRGLCGTYDGVEENDFTTRDMDIEASVALFAAGYVLENEDCPELVDRLTYESCSINARNVIRAENDCSFLKSSVFEACHGLVEVDLYYENCMHDVCGGNDHDVDLCGSIAAYARECALAGTPVHDWRLHEDLSESNCEMTCSVGGQEYQECGNACEHSCADLTYKSDCSYKQCVAGCNCQEGKVLDSTGQCVPHHACSCVYNGKTYPSRSVIEHPCQNCTCLNGTFECDYNDCDVDVVCPKNQVFQQFTTQCPKTCENFNLEPTCRLSYTPGCTCPEGLVLDDDICVEPHKCSCRHNGLRYENGEKIKKDCNECVCGGRHWDCTKHKCSGTCIATGDPHYITFDGKKYSFMGNCRYVLAKEVDNAFVVTAENVPCGAAGVTCTKSVHATIGSVTVELLRGREVLVNDLGVQLPKVYNSLRLDYSGMYVILRSDVGLDIMWDGATRLYITIQPEYNGKVEGLCGNYDGIAHNDFLSQDGVIEARADNFANSWKVSENMCIDVNSDIIPDPCEVNRNRLTWAQKSCDIMRHDLFQPCHTAVDPEIFIRCCTFGGDCECLCTAIAAYAEQCNKHGIYIRWRSQDLCPMQCDYGTTYMACGPVCQEKCDERHPIPEEYCTGCVEGCFCPSGMVLRGQECVPAEECPCEHNNVIYPTGSSFSINCKNCTCMNGNITCLGDPCFGIETCAPDEFSCDNGKCIPVEWTCDAAEDCGDSSDETDCVYNCTVNEFTCRNGHCININYKCDGMPDCTDESDEFQCGPNTCDDDLEFLCSNGVCIPHTFVCDGEHDCGFGDNSDEESCEEPTCAPTEFSCNTQGTCIPLPQLCDKHDDCGDGSDEIGCDGPCPDECTCYVDCDGNFVDGECESDYPMCASCFCDDSAVKAEDGGMCLVHPQDCFKSMYTIGDPTDGM